LHRSKDRDECPNWHRSLTKGGEGYSEKGALLELITAGMVQIVSRGEIPVKEIRKGYRGGEKKESCVVVL